MMKSETNQITFIGMLVAVVMASTYIGFPTPGSMGGYIHFGTLASVVIALKYGKKAGMLAGGIGATLFDLFSPYAIWAPATLVIRVVIGYLMGKISEDSQGQGSNLRKNIIAITVGGVILVLSYFGYQTLFLGYMPNIDPKEYGMSAALVAIPGNIIQVLISFVSIYIIRKVPTINLSEKAM